jgi:2-succinyl-6-hydroxy-2,4-cyclohexadiene-1-carboxylate synthase
MVRVASSSEGVSDAVLLHGFTNTGASWDPVARALPPSCHVQAPDLRGHGAAADVRPVSLEAVIEDLDAVVPQQGATLAGYSMGGRIALHYAIQRPGRLRRLTLIGASPGLADPAERHARRSADAHLADRIERMGIEAFAAEWARLPLWDGMDPRAAAAAHEDRLRNSAHGLAAALRGLGTGALQPLWDRLGELTVPVTLVVGERDAKFRAIARHMEPLLPLERLQAVPGAGHAAHLEAPEQVARAIQDSTDAD